MGSQFLFQLSTSSSRVIVSADSRDMLIGAGAGTSSSSGTPRMKARASTRVSKLRFIRSRVPSGLFSYRRALNDFPF